MLFKVGVGDEEEAGEAGSGLADGDALSDLVGQGVGEGGIVSVLEVLERVEHLSRSRDVMALLGTLDERDERFEWGVGKTTD